MKVAFVAASNSIHTERWVRGLNKRGVNVHLISQHSEYHGVESGLVFHPLPIKNSLGYVANVFALKRLLHEIKPDLLNVHYASGYGTLARFADFHPTLLSVWGSDVYDFSGKSTFHRKLITGNLLFADGVASTSKDMGRRVEELIGHVKKIYITPFGVDCEKFKQSSGERNNSKIVIGTVKTLENIYGIDLLLRSFALLKQRLALSAPHLGSSLRLKIVGGGADHATLKDLSAGLGIADTTEFVGAVPHEEVPNWLNQFDIYAALSRSESFGVAILEASACGLPVVVSDVGGLPEVVENEKTGLIVRRENVEAAALALERLVIDADLRRRMGAYGREFVMHHYSWEKSLDIMLDTYEYVICGSKNNREVSADQKTEIIA